MTKIRILFVCLGNICRSPVAEGVFRKKIKDSNLTDKFELDSAGTAAWHVGKSPDNRMMEAANLRGYDLSDLRARQAIASDFEKFDYILAMDTDNLYNLEDMNPGTGEANLSLFLDYAATVKDKEVPDPYYGKKEGFNHVIDLVEEAADGLIEKLNTKTTA